MNKYAKNIFNVIKCWINNKLIEEILNIKLFCNFSLKITGPWFEISRIPNAFENDDKCSVIKYELNQQLGSFNLSLDAVKSR